jgi:hypothetical protein
MSWIDYRQRRGDPPWVVRWSHAGTGRWWKRQLSKARRRLGRAHCYGRRAKSSNRYEHECNWKLT